MFNNVPLEKREEFIEKFPTAYYWLLKEQLKGERAALQDELNYINPESQRAVWIKQRLEDLKEIN